MEEMKEKLLTLGFNADSIGITYWIDAIKYIKEHPLWWDIYDIYEYLATKYKISVARVERNLRTAIAPAKKNIQEKYKYYRSIKNSTFLHLIKIELI